MQQELIWLSVSLFCNKNNWSKLMSEGITGFVSFAPKLINYTIEFNYLSGENIRLALLIDKRDAPAMAQIVNKYFNNYFASANLMVKPVKPPFVGVFMPFPANSIQYGLYTPQIINADEVEKHKIAIDLSAIMLEALQDEIDDETIITFTFYLQMGVIRSVCKYLDNVDELFLIIGNLMNNNYKIDEDITSSYSIMDEITVDVMQMEKFAPDLNWMNSWTNECANALRLVAKDSDENISLKQFYGNRIAATNRCLGLNANSKELLNHLINRSLREYFIINNQSIVPHGKN